LLESINSPSPSVATVADAIKTVVATTVTCGVYLRGIDETYFSAFHSFCIEAHSVFVLHAATDRLLLVMKTQRRARSTLLMSTCYVLYHRSAGPRRFTRFERRPRSSSSGRRERWQRECRTTRFTWYVQALRI